MARANRWNWKQALVGTAKRRAEPFQTLEEIEADHIGKVLEAYDHNLLHAAKALGISRSTLYRRMARVIPGAPKSAAKAAPVKIATAKAATAKAAVAAKGKR